jgi:hypothetical protein
MLITGTTRAKEVSAIRDEKAGSECLQAIAAEHSKDPKRLILYHGSKAVVQSPAIQVTQYNQDFYFGFYCTLAPEQAIRRALRFDGGILNLYAYQPDQSLNILCFPEMTEAWLDFIVACRRGQPHDYDVVEGPMVDDIIFNEVQNFVDGKISREAFWALAKGKKPAFQRSFHTEKALTALTFLEGRVVCDEK